MIFRSGDDDIVDIDAGNLDHPRIETAVGNDVFDLNDDLAAAVVNGLSHGNTFERPDFFVHRNITRFIGIGAAKEGDLYGEGRIEQLFMAFNFNQFNQVFLGYVVQFAAELPGIQESFQPDVGEDAKLVAGQGTEPMNECALRKVIGFDFIIDSQFPDSRYGLPVTDDGSF